MSRKKDTGVDPHGAAARAEQDIKTIEKAGGADSYGNRHTGGQTTLKGKAYAGAEAAGNATVNLDPRKGAVKAGQRLNPEEIRSLLRRRDETGAVSTCPHGRPVALKLTLDYLDKHFKRR